MIHRHGSRGGKRSLYISALTLAFVAMSPPCPADVFENNFAPWRAVKNRDGQYYGTIQQRGARAGGVYTLSPAGKYHLLHGSNVFKYTNKLSHFGASLHPSLGTGQDGSIYGTARESGMLGCGFLFKIDRKGAYSVLHYFESFSYGIGPVLAATNGDVFTSFSYDQNRLFRLSKSGSVKLIDSSGHIMAIAENANHEIVVATATYPPNGSLWRLNTNDELEHLATVGDQPLQLVPLPDGDILCLTQHRLVRVSNTGEVSLIHEFNLAFQGLAPSFVTTAKDGTYIGTTLGGGLENHGTVFQIHPDTKEYMLLDHLPHAGGRGFGAGWMDRFFPLRVAADSGNLPPMASDDVVPARRLKTEGDALPKVIIDVLENDADANRDPLTLSAVGVPRHGVAEIDPATQTIVYTANSAQIENDTFTYTIVDDQGGSSIGHVTIRTNAEGRYRGEVSSPVNEDTGDPGTVAGALSVVVNADRTATARLEFLGKTYRFNGRFNEVNQFGAVLVSAPRVNKQLGIQLWLQPNGSAWKVNATIRNNGLPFLATCSLDEP